MEPPVDHMREAEDVVMAVLSKGGAMGRGDMLFYIGLDYGWPGVDVDLLIQRLLAGGRIEGKSYGPKMMYRLRRPMDVDGDI